MLSVGFMFPVILLFVFFFMGVGYYILFVGSVIFVNCNATVYPPLLYFGLMPCYEPLAQWEGCFSLPA